MYARKNVTHPYARRTVCCYTLMLMFNYDYLEFAANVLIITNYILKGVLGKLCVTSADNSVTCFKCCAVCVCMINCNNVLCCLFKTGQRNADIMKVPSHAFLVFMISKHRKFGGIHLFGRLLQ